LDVADLRVFEAVARLRNMNRASEELNTVQSNVTARIRQLETGLGVRLFERHSRGVSLTSAGAKLLPFAAKAMQLMADARRAISDADSPSGPLVLGSLETTLALRLSQTLAGFAALYPAVDLTLRSGTTAELIEMVLDYQVEGAFVCGPVRHPDLEEVLVCREELALLAAPRFASLEAVLGSTPLKQIVLRAGCSYRQRLEDILARRGLVASRVLEFATLESIFASVSSGVGITLMPRGLARDFANRHRVSVHRLPPDESDVVTAFVTRRDAYASPARQAFVDRVRTAFQQRQAAE